MNALLHNALTSLEHINDEEKLTEFVIIEGSVLLGEEIISSEAFGNLIQQLLEVNFVSDRFVHLFFNGPIFQLEINGELESGEVNRIQSLLSQLENIIFMLTNSGPEAVEKVFSIGVFPSCEPTANYVA